jgi:hypothetical protein
MVIIIPTDDTSGNPANLFHQPHSRYVSASREYIAETICLLHPCSHHSHSKHRTITQSSEQKSPVPWAADAEEGRGSRLRQSTST